MSARSVGARRFFCKILCPDNENFMYTTESDENIKILVFIAIFFNKVNLTIKKYKLYSGNFY